MKFATSEGNAPKRARKPRSIDPNALYVSPPQAAVLVGMSESYLERARAEGIGPRFRKIGVAVRYAIEDLREWVESGRAATEHLAPPRVRAGKPVRS